MDTQLTLKHCQLSFINQRVQLTKSWFESRYVPVLDLRELNIFIKHNGIISIEDDNSQFIQMIKTASELFYQNFDNIIYNDKL